MWSAPSPSPAQAHTCHKEGSHTEPTKPSALNCSCGQPAAHPSQLFGLALSLHFPVLISHFVGSLCVPRMVLSPHTQPCYSSSSSSQAGL